ncbi:hypothetical protein B0H14DRAFT_2564421 [Mycena olivaceomarginata]|nr:hypothetical protein B0H14DRAFT_2564421 [Mycena olivaceomarginata]
MDWPTQNLASIPENNRRTEEGMLHGPSSRHQRNEGDNLDKNAALNCGEKDFGSHERRQTRVTKRQIMDVCIEVWTMREAFHQNFRFVDGFDDEGPEYATLGLDATGAQATCEKLLFTAPFQSIFDFSQEQHRISCRSEDENSCPEAQNSLRTDTCIRQLEASAEYNEPKRTEKVAGSSSDIYTVDELRKFARWCLKNFSEPQRVYLGLRDRAMLLMGAALLFGEIAPEYCCGPTCSRPVFRSGMIWKQR